MLREYLDHELIHVNEELDQLHPPFTGPPQSNLIQLCNSYTYEISKFAEGQKDYELFIQAATQVYSNLRKAISRSRLTFDTDEEIESDHSAMDEGEPEDRNIEEDVVLEQFVIAEPNRGIMFHILI